MIKVGDVIRIIGDPSIYPRHWDGCIGIMEGINANYKEWGCVRFHFDCSELEGGYAHTHAYIKFIDMEKLR